MKAQLARWLRNLAQRLDRREMVDGGLYRTSVMSTNKYVGQTERYIVALEAEVTPERVERLRLDHERFDTSGLLRAGAWREG